MPCPDFRDHVTPIYAAHNILNIKDLISLKNLLLIHDYFRDKLPSTFNDYYKLEQYQDPQNIEAPMVTQVPARFQEYELTEADMQPQNHNDIYRFRNENILGQQLTALCIRIQVGKIWMEFIKTCIYLIVE